MKIWLICPYQKRKWDFPGDPMVKIQGFTAEAVSLIPGQGTTISTCLAVWQKIKREKKIFRDHDANSVNANLTIACTFH